jgi:hypothetical protein
VRALAGVAALALGACVAAPLSPDARVTLEAGPCFGTCPVYRVTLDARDVAVFEGERHVAQRGRHERQFPAGTLAGLLKELDALGAFGLAGLYAPGSKNCARHATDHPSRRFTLDDGQRRIEVAHDLGCLDAPPRLREIEALIEERSGARRWITEAPAS